MGLENKTLLLFAMLKLLENLGPHMRASALLKTVSLYEYLTAW